MQNHIWGMHCFLLSDQFESMASKFETCFRDQKEIVKISWQYEKVSGLATFEVITTALLDQQAIRLFENYLSRLNILYYPFSNEDGGGQASECLFLAIRNDYVPGIVAEVLRQNFSVWFLVGRLKSHNTVQVGNFLFVSVVAKDTLPDNLVATTNKQTNASIEYFRHHVK